MKTVNKKRPPTRKPVKKNTPPVKRKEPDQLESIINMMAEKGANFGEIEGLLKMQAQQKFQKALLAFQTEIPELPRDGRSVDEEGKPYSYTLLPTMKRVIQPYLTKHGLTYHWEFDRDDEYIVCVCVITHLDGHKQRSTMKAEEDDSETMNNMQGIGSSMTYLQRYTLIASLGLTSADQDNDGKSSKIKGREDHTRAGRNSN